MIEGEDAVRKRAVVPGTLISLLSSASEYNRSAYVPAKLPGSDDDYDDDDNDDTDIDNGTDSFSPSLPLLPVWLYVEMTGLLTERANLSANIVQNSGRGSKGSEDGEGVDGDNSTGNEITVVNYVGSETDFGSSVMRIENGAGIFVRMKVTTYSTVSTGNEGEGIREGGEEEEEEEEEEEGQEDEGALPRPPWIEYTALHVTGGDVRCDECIFIFSGRDDDDRIEGSAAGMAGQQQHRQQRKALKEIQTRTQTRTQMPTYSHSHTPHRYSSLISSSLPSTLTSRPTPALPNSQNSPVPPYPSSLIVLLHHSCFIATSSVFCHTNIGCFTVVGSLLSLVTNNTLLSCKFFGEESGAGSTGSLQLFPHMKF
ncbi:hypothetical protein FACS189472_14950 [Alphaproteobacteria bacterium]|nr:hypothetical protein FACS189472_14950 [Alphaproteobacteria bacterium]